MVDIESIRFLWRYMVHADEQILTAIATVPEEGYVRDQHISFGSVQKLVGHCMTVQKLWLRRLAGENIPYADEPPLARPELAQAWAEIHSGLLTFAQEQTKESIMQVIRSTNRAGRTFELPVWSAMLHLADHGTYHRGQLNSMIKLAGGKPSTVAIYTYCVETGIGRDVT